MLKAALHSQVPFKHKQVMFGMISRGSKILRQEKKTSINEFVHGKISDLSLQHDFILSFLYFFDNGFTAAFCC